MFTDLCQFDLAKEFAASSGRHDVKTLITKQADWAKDTNDPRAAWWDVVPTFATYRIAGKFGGLAVRATTTKLNLANISVLNVCAYNYTYDTLPDRQI